MQDKNLLKSDILMEFLLKVQNNIKNFIKTRENNIL